MSEMRNGSHTVAQYGGRIFKCWEDKCVVGPLSDLLGAVDEVASQKTKST